MGLLLYLSPDREDIHRGVQLLTRKLKEPDEFDRRRLVKVVRYLKGSRTFGILLTRPTGKATTAKLDLYTDTDFATCPETRRAMTCGVTRVDDMPFAGFARRQGVQTTSSGEAEFYGAASVVMDGRIVKHALEWLGYKVEYTLYLDSSAAKAMINREGVGKLKHMDVRALWLQAERRDFGLRVAKVAGEKNVADLGTKAHPERRFLELRTMSGLIDCTEIDENTELQADAISAD